MKEKLYVTIIGLLVSLPVTSHAAQVDDATVVNFGVYGTGRIFITLDKEVPETGCVKSRVDVVQDNPSASTVTTIALVALSSGKKVKVRTTGCYDGYPIINASEDGWIFIKN